MKYFVRRIAAIIAIIAFFLPWFDLMLLNVNGIQLIKASFGLGNAINEPGITAFGIIALIIIASAIWTAIQPKLISSIIFLVPTLLLLIIFFSVDGTEFVMEMGVYVLTLGVIGVFVSFFLTSNPATNRQIIHTGTQEMAATQEATIPTSPQQEKKFCGNCGNEIFKNSTFCSNCGAGL